MAGWLKVRGEGLDFRMLLLVGKVTFFGGGGLLRAGPEKEGER